MPVAYLGLALPPGLIAMEVLSNALKHAFPGKGAGEVTVSFRSPCEGRLGALEVRDNDIGGEGGASKGTGLNLVRAIAKQVGGRIDVAVDKGTVFTLSFAARENSLVGAAPR